MDRMHKTRKGKRDGENKVFLTITILDTSAYQAKLVDIPGCTGTVDMYFGHAT